MHLFTVTSVQFWEDFFSLQFFSKAIRYIVLTIQTKSSSGLFLHLNILIIRDVPILILVSGPIPSNVIVQVS